MGDYVKWTRVYPDNESEKYEGVATTETIADGSITNDKLSFDVSVKGGDSAVRDGSITTGKIADGAVTKIKTSI